MNAGNVQAAMQLLKRAFEVSPRNPVVMNHLANHFFFKGDWIKAERFARQSYECTDVPEIKAESAYLLGRCYHSHDNYNEAHIYYEEAIKYNKNNILAIFGKGQIYLQRNELDIAKKCFQEVMDQFPGNIDCMKVLGYVYNQKKIVDTEERKPLFERYKSMTADKYRYPPLSDEKKILGEEIKKMDAEITKYEKMAKGMTNEASKLDPYDSDVLLNLVQFLNVHEERKKALDLYEKAEEHIEKGDKNMYIIWNNEGVMNHLLGNLEKAKILYEKAIVASKHFTHDNCTTTYNLACLHNSTHSYLKAEELFKSILKEHPNYIDCYLKLGVMAQERGHIHEAAEWFKEALTINHSCADAWTFLGCLHMDKEEWQPAQKKYEHVLQVDNTDEYSLIALGNIYYAAKFDKKEREERYLELALDSYARCLRHGPCNYLAANGLSAILAEKGRLQEAMDFFLQVREVAGDYPDVWINIGHIFFIQKQYHRAEKMYANCISRYSLWKDIQVLLFWANSLYHCGKNDQCNSVLQKALHFDPHNLLVQFNLYVVLKTSAELVLSKPRSTVGEIQYAVENLKISQKGFEQLGSLEKVRARFLFRPSYATSLGHNCKVLLTSASKFLKEAEEKQQMEAHKQEIIRRQNEIAQQRRREKKNEEEKRIAEENAHLQKLAEEDLNRQKELAKTWASTHSKYTEDNDYDKDEGDPKDQPRRKKTRQMVQSSVEREPEFESIKEETGSKETNPESKEKWEEMRDSRTDPASSAMAELIRRKRDREKGNRAMEDEKRRVDLMGEIDGSESSGLRKRKR